MLSSEDKIISISRGEIKFLCNKSKYRVTGEALLRKHGSSIDFLVDEKSLSVDEGVSRDEVWSKLRNMMSLRDMKIEIS